MFPIKTTKGEGLKILTPKQMLERLQIALAQVKAGTHLKLYLMKSDISYILCNEFNKGII